MSVTVALISTFLYMSFVYLFSIHSKIYRWCLSSSWLAAGHAWGNECALEWELVAFPSRKFVVDCRWIFSIKVGPYGINDRLKSRPVANSYTQIFGINYGDTFSPMKKMAFVRLFKAITAFQRWPLYQLHVKNVFLNKVL